MPCRRPGSIRNPFYWLGFKLFGRMLQRRFSRQSLARMRRLVGEALAHRQTKPVLAQLTRTIQPKRRHCPAGRSRRFCRLFFTPNPPFHVRHQSLRGSRRQHSASRPFTIERRAPGAHDVQIEILFCGVCHSDLHQIRDEWGGTVYPMVPGHEIVGRVTAVGAGVKKFKRGRPRRRRLPRRLVPRVPERARRAWSSTARHGHDRAPTTRRDKRQRRRHLRRLLAAHRGRRGVRAEDPR